MRAEARQVLHPDCSRVDARRSGIHHRRALRTAHSGTAYQLGDLSRLRLDLRLEVAFTFYAIDIVAWDVFFGLALLFAVPAFAGRVDAIWV
jgi:hypothetical protein